MAHGIDPADQAADAGADNHVVRELILFQVLEGAHGRSAFRTAAAQDKGQGGTVSPNRIHPGAHGPHRLGVGRVQPETGRFFVLPLQENREKQYDKQKISFHKPMRGCAARPAGRRRRGCPRPGRRGWWR